MSLDWHFIILAADTYRPTGHWQYQKGRPANLLQGCRKIPHLQVNKLQPSKGTHRTTLKVLCAWLGYVLVPVGYSGDSEKNALMQYVSRLFWSN